jgi:VanZ family protein
MVQWAELVVWMALIFCLSGDSFQSSHTLIAVQYWVACFHLPISPPNLLLLHGVLRKGAHFGEFFVLGILLYRTLSSKYADFRVKLACWVLILGLLLALGDELRQVSASYRTASIRDSALDFAGVIASQLWILLRSAVCPGVPTHEDAGGKGSGQA